MSDSVSVPAARRASASARWNGVSAAGLPMCCPRALARALPSLVRVMISDRSNSAKPARTVVSGRPCGVVVCAHVSPSDRKTAPLAVISCNVLSRSRVLRASRSILVTISTSPAWPSPAPQRRKLSTWFNENDLEGVAFEHEMIEAQTNSSGRLRAKSGERPAESRTENEDDQRHSERDRESNSKRSPRSRRVQLDARFRVQLVTYSVVGLVLIFGEQPPKRWHLIPAVWRVGICIPRAIWRVVIRPGFATRLFAIDRNHRDSHGAKDKRRLFTLA